MAQREALKFKPGLITIPYKPRDYQRQIHNDPQRFKIAVFHRQAGKTTFAVNHLIRAMITDPGTYLYVAPEKGQAKNIIWKPSDGLFHYLPEELIARRNEVELTVYLHATKKVEEKPVGSVFFIEGTDNIDRMRGLRPKGVIFDEFDQMPEEVWNEIIFPAINESGGWVLFIGTFKGKSHLYKMFSKYWDWVEMKSIEDPNWKCYYLPYYKNPYFSAEQAQLARETMPPLQFDQEYGCMPMSGNSTVFPDISELCTESPKTPVSGHRYAIGVDLAKTVDFTAITVIDMVTRKQVRQERWQSDWSVTMERITMFKRQYPGVCVIDSTGVGDPISEMLKKRNVKVVDFKFSNSKKEQLVKKIGVVFSEKTVALLSPDYAANMIDEVRQYNYTLTPQGLPKYGAPVGFHDDEVTSLMLAVWAMSNVPVESWDMEVKDSTPPLFDPWYDGSNRNATVYVGGDL